MQKTGCFEQSFYIRLKKSWGHFEPRISADIRPYQRNEKASDHGVCGEVLCTGARIAD